MVEMEKPIHVSRGRVYWSETDAAVMMHFSNFFRICEKTEEDFFETLGLRFDPDSTIVFPRAHASCDYHYPLYPGDKYRVAIVEIVVGRTSIEYSFEIHNETHDKLSAKCRIVAVAYDKAMRKPVPIPDALKKLLIERGAREKYPRPVH